MPISSNEAVPIPINHSFAVIGAVQVAIQKIKTWTEIGAVLANIPKKKMKARTVLVNHLRNQVLDKDRARDLRLCAIS